MGYGKKENDIDHDHNNMIKEIGINKDAIIELEDELLRAIRSSDISALDKLLHDDLLFIAPNGQVVTKKMDLDSHQAGTMVIEKLIRTIEQVNLIDNLAVVIVVYETEGKMLGKSIQGHFRYIRIWKQQDGQWKVVGGSCTQI